jgi:putative DNA primase/helicase
LVKKAIEPRGARQFGDRLVIPVITLESGQLRSLQFIGPSGEKRFLSHGEIRGNVMPVHINGADRVLLCEGFATAATMAQIDSGATTLAALSAHNLKAAAQAIKRRWPRCQLDIVADADPVGIAKAREAAKAVGANVIVPKLSPDEIAAGCTDINDMVRVHGAAAALKVVCHG